MLLMMSCLEASPVAGAAARSTDENIAADMTEDHHVQAVKQPATTAMTGLRIAIVAKIERSRYELRGESRVV
jgi:hypothetical protein